MSARRATVTTRWKVLARGPYCITILGSYDSEASALRAAATERARSYGAVEVDCEVVTTTPVADFSEMSERVAP